HDLHPPGGVEGRARRRVDHRRPLRVHPQPAGRHEAAVERAPSRRSGEAAAAARQGRHRPAGKMTASLPRTVNPQDLDPGTVRLLPYPFAKSKGVLAARMVDGALEVWIK